MKKTIITLGIAAAALISFAQDKVNSGERNQAALNQVRSSVAGNPVTVQSQAALRDQAKVQEAKEKMDQNGANTERARAFETMRNSSGKATLQNANIQREHRGAATLTPEQNQARIERMNQFREQQKAREKGVTSIKANPSPDVRPTTLRQPQRPATLSERKASGK